MPEQAPTLFIRQLADQAFSRASGAPLRDGNHVRHPEERRRELSGVARGDRGCPAHDPLRDVHHPRGRSRAGCFADALMRKAAEGVRSGSSTTGWAALARRRAGSGIGCAPAGVEVRCYNPPRFDRPLGWVSRDHRKMIAVDGAVAFVTGLCVGQSWVGDPQRGIDPWRDTGSRCAAPRWPTSRGVRGSLGHGRRAAAGDDAAPIRRLSRCRRRRR